MPVFVEPKLLNHAGKRDNQGSSDNLDVGRGKDYVVARLERDGKAELAEQVRSGVKSARKASIEAGFKVPESQITVLKRAWKKSSEVERNETSSAFTSEVD